MGSCGGSWPGKDALVCEDLLGTIYDLQFKRRYYEQEI